MQMALMHRGREPSRSPRPRRGGNNGGERSGYKSARAHTPRASRRGESSHESGSMRDNNRPLTVEETLELCRRLVDCEQVHDSEMLEGARPKLTINLGRSRIPQIPDAMVDMIKDEVARLSLAHNFLERFPPRFSECIHLRYLNIRGNKFTHFPQEVFSLPYLEILDLSRNKITHIPRMIRELTSLRVLSIMQNYVEDIPDELAGMTQLQILKISGNPLIPALRQILENKEEASNSAGEAADKEPSMTFEIKKFLKGRRQHAANSNTDPVPPTEGTYDAPRPARKGNRFPVVPSRQGSASSHDGKQLSVSSKPPPIPVRSHYRLASGSLRTGASSTLPNPNPDSNGLSERNRSKSEGRIQSVTSPSSKQRPATFVRKNTVLGTLDEMRPYRPDHARFNSGSDGIAGYESGSSSPVSPRHPKRYRERLVRRMPSISGDSPHKERAQPLMDGARSLLFSFFQIHPHITSLVELLSGEDRSRSSMEILLYNASILLGRLDETLKKAETIDWMDQYSADLAIDSMRRETEGCIMAFMHVGSHLQINASKTVSLCDPRYIRSFLLLIYGSLVEFRNATKSFSTQERPPLELRGLRLPRPLQVAAKQPERCEESTSPPIPIPKDTSRPPSRTRRQRSETMIPPFPHMRKPSPAQLLGRPPVPQVPPLTPLSKAKDRSRSNSKTQVVVDAPGPPSLFSTPKSESFPVAPPPLSPGMGVRLSPSPGADEGEGEREFEKIFVQLKTACSTTLQAVPTVHRLFTENLALTEESRGTPDLIALWNRLLNRSGQCIDFAEKLNHRLSNMRVKEPSGDMRQQKEFWHLCKSFLQSFIELITDMRAARNLSLLSPDVATILRPVQKASREAGRLIEASPWSGFAELNNPPPANVPKEGIGNEPLPSIVAPPPPPPPQLNTSIVPPSPPGPTPPPKLGPRSATAPSPITVDMHPPSPNPLFRPPPAPPHFLDRPLPPKPPVQRIGGPNGLSISHPTLISSSIGDLRR